MSVVINPERDRLSLQLCMGFVMFLVYFQDNQYDIKTYNAVAFYFLLACRILCATGLASTVVPFIRCWREDHCFA